MQRRAGRFREERGAALVEFSFIAPVLILLVFGIVDFGWAFAQHQDVRHGAREGARLAAVNYGTATGAAQTNQIRQEVCDRTNSLNNDTTEVAVDLPSGTNEGDVVSVTIRYPATSVTGFFSALLKFDLVSTVDMRLERDATYADSESAGTFVCG